MLGGDLGVCFQRVGAETSGACEDWRTTREGGNDKK